MHIADFKAARQPAADQRMFAMRGPDACGGADTPTDQHVALPVPLHLYASDCVIQRQRLECVYSRVIRAIFGHEWRDRTGDRGDLAAGKALVAVAREESVRVARLRWTLARKSELHELRRRGRYSY